MPKDRFDFIKLKIDANQNLVTTIDNKRYTLNDVNELVNKIAEQKIGKNNAIKEYNNLIYKEEQITKLTSTEHRQKMLKIFNYLGEIFNGPNTSEKLKLDNLYSLYRSKKLTKQPYKSLIDII